MPSTLTTLQRIRFCAISPESYQNEAFFKTNFQRDLWERLGRACYWSKTGTSAAAIHDPEAVTIPAGETVDGDAYFNAFFLAYWRKLTCVQNLGLRLRFAGKLRIRIRAHTALTETETLVDEVVHHPEEADWVAVLPAAELPQAAIRLSFALTANLKSGRLSGGEWMTPDAPRRAVAPAIVIPTYNRSSFARKTVTSLLNDERAAALFERIVLIEQSDKPELADLAGPKCSYLRQPNLGGAGGFARGMYECVLEESMGKVTHLLFMDDDVMIETDAILRVIQMAAFARENFVLGGGMLNLFRPDVAVALGEANEVCELGFYTLKQVYAQAEVSTQNTLNLASLPQPVGYCAWWFCFFPCEVVREIGLPLPCFFRGDDIQWGVRAREAGYEPYLVPGIGVWHLPFQSKSLPWVTYFDRYNTLVGNALHGQTEVERFFAYSLYETRLLLGQKRYAYAAVAISAMENYLRGWAHYRDRSFPALLGEVKAIQNEFSIPEVTPAALARLRPLIEALERRLSVLTASYSKQGWQVREEFFRQMPQAYTRRAWSAYFESGNLKHLAPSESNTLSAHAAA